MSIDSTRDRARDLYHGHRHPFSAQDVKGWHARPGKETVIPRAAANSELDHPPERGVPISIKTCQSTSTSRRACNNESDQHASTDRSVDHQQHGGPTATYSLMLMRCQPRMSDAMSRTEKLVVTETCMMGMTPTRAMGRADRLAMSFGKGWSLKNYENNKPW
jgi:hypothetical protein